MVRRLILILLLAGAAQAQFDITPYKFMCAGNSYYGTTNTDSFWIARRYDCLIAGLGDPDSMNLTGAERVARDSGKEFWIGPYASSQEINLFESDITKSYNERLLNVAGNWKYIYAKHYLDSIGVSAESLVVHIEDDTINITQQGDGNRGYNLTGLAYHQKRFTYQYWNNDATDTMFYPAGYVWEINGFNDDACEAIAYAYRRHIIEDSADYGNGDIMYTAYFMDNQYRSGTIPRLGTYYAINYTSGGTSSQLDWYEQAYLQTQDTLYKVFDSSICQADKRIMEVLDSACAANSLKPIYGFANIDKFSETHLSAILPFVNAVSLEHPIDYTKGPSNWRNWYKMADTMAAHPEVYIDWLLGDDILCSGTPGDWNYDSSRIYLAHYTFFLTVQDTNAFIGPARYNRQDRWRDIYTVNFGDPDSAAWTISYTGNSDYGATPYIYVKGRTYNNGTVFMLFRTAHGSASYTDDSVAVNLAGGEQKVWYEVNVNADTSVTADSLFYIKPYQGIILVLAGEQAPGISSILPTSGYKDSTYDFSATVTDDYGVNHIYNYVWDTTPDSISIFDSVYTPGDTAVIWSVSHEYTPLDSGNYYIVWVAVDDSTHISRESTQVLFDVYPAPPSGDSATFILDGVSVMGVSTQ